MVLDINLIDEFKKIFGSEGDIFEYFAPGRVNLIGEHIDYNGGLVFPCALDFGTYGVIRLRDDNLVSFSSLNFDKRVTIDLGLVEYKDEDDWTNYPKGIIHEFLALGFSLTGFDILFYGNIPNGAGLSSSASLEVLTGTILNDLFNCNLNMVDIVLLSQRAENKFVGVNCGIMDQFAVGMGKRNNGILLNCNTLEYEYVPLKLEGIKIVIGNTKKRRGLADSKYNQRRGECDKALSLLQKELNIDYLCDLDEKEFNNSKYLISDSILLKRAEHVVLENQRTLRAKKCLGEGDIISFGTLMNESHNSLRDLYEVTGDELDIMVEEARDIPGTIGSRMTGAGFGGCAVSLVLDGSVDNFIKVVGDNYKKRTGLNPEFYVADIGSGPRRI